MKIEKTQTGESITLALEGRLDTLSAPQLQKALSEIFPEAAAIELDFVRIEYVSSAGLRVLLLGEKTAKATGKTMTLINVSTDIMQVFDVTGFTGILNIN